jgi:hypothetical protein
MEREAAVTNRICDKTTLILIISAHKLLIINIDINFLNM